MLFTLHAVQRFWLCATRGEKGHARRWGFESCCRLGEALGERFVKQTVPLIVAVVLLTGCTPPATVSSSDGSSPSAVASGAAPRVPVTAGLSADDIRYGAAPTRNPMVVYQPDVVIPEGGGHIVRSVSGDGLTWTIDATAPHASEIAPGKIMFVTNRAVGRVLGATRSGDDLAVTLGPVNITDVIEEAHVAGDQNLDLNSMIAYTAPNLPGAAVDPLEALVPSYDQPAFASFEEAIDDGMQLVQATMPGPSTGPPDVVAIEDFKVHPFCCGGLGVKIEHDANDVHILAYAVLRLSNPRVRFKLDITRGHVDTAEVELLGMAGLTMHFDARTTIGVNGNVRKTFFVPMDLSFPIVGAGVPLALTLHQSFSVTTFFSAKNSRLTATGDYAFAGSMYMGLHQGSWGVGAPTNFTVKQSLLDSINGVSIGTSGLIIAVEDKVLLGIGAFGFITGPYLGYDAGFGISRGSDTMTGLVGVTCTGADFDLGLHAEVGYSISKPVASAINSVLHFLHFKPIARFGGVDHREPLIHKHSARPERCDTKPS